MIPVADERVAPRFQKDTTVFIEMTASAPDSGEDADIVICKSHDLSSTGVQVVLDRSIPEGSILRLCLDTRGRQPVFVVAEVMWQRRNDETDEYHVGFMLLDSRGSDFSRWQEAIAEMFD